VKKLSAGRTGGRERTLDINMARELKRVRDLNEADFAEFVNETLAFGETFQKPRVDDPSRLFREWEREAKAASSTHQDLTKVRLTHSLTQSTHSPHLTKTVDGSSKARLFDPLNIAFLARFVSVYGTIKSRKQTRLSAKDQKSLNLAIRRARHMGLLSSKHKTFTVISPFAELQLERTDDGEWLPAFRRGNSAAAADDDDDLAKLVAEAANFPDEEVEASDRAAVALADVEVEEEPLLATPVVDETEEGKELRRRKKELEEKHKKDAKEPTKKTGKK
jgi:ribosomal protein S18